MTAEAFTIEVPSERVRIMTISHAIDLYLGELTRQGRRPKTLASYRRTLDKLADMYPQHDVEELTATMVRRFLDTFQTNAKKGHGVANSSTTIGQRVGHVDCFFKWLHGEELIPRVPWMGWPERLACNVGLGTGARREALAQARRRDYDPFARTLTFQEKGGKTIVKPVPEFLGDVLDAAIVAGVYDDDDAYLIPSLAKQRRSGGRDPRIVSRLIARVAERAGVTTHVHALRSAYAVSFLEEMGTEQIFALKDLLGHARIETTQIYLRRLDRRRSMETVRGFTWGLESAQVFEANALTEKEGFEPSFNAKSHGNRVGFPSAARRNDA